MDSAAQAVLAQELAVDPLQLGYAGLADSAAADRLNRADRPGRAAVKASDVRRYVLLRGLWPALQDLAAGGADPVAKGTAATVLQTLAPNSFDEIRMNDPEVRAAVAQMLLVLVNAGVLAEQNRVEMLALGDAAVSRADELGLGFVHHLDVARARGNG